MRTRTASRDGSRQAACIRYLNVPFIKEPEIAQKSRKREIVALGICKHPAQPADTALWSFCPRLLTAAV